MGGPVPIGTVVDRFRVTSLLAEGAMGTVYVAEDDDGNRVALKILSAQLAQDDRFHERFLRETHIARDLDDLHIVRTIDSGEQDGVLWLAMELIDGIDLRTLLKREGALDPRSTIQLLAQVAEALDAAHASGLVHRDVKPGNILIRGDEAFVCDFGLARHVSSVSSLTSERGFVGTIDYVPPEQIQGGALDGRADVYSLGCVLFECLTGARPFQADSDLTTLFGHLNEPPPRVSDHKPNLPETVDEVIARALAKDPNDRFSTCGELIAAADAGLAGRSLRRARRRRGAVAAGGAVLLTAAIAAGVLATHGSHKRLQAVTRSPVIKLKPSTLTLLDARTKRVTSKVTLSSKAPFCCSLDDIEFTKRSAWLDFSGAPQLAEVDLSTRRLVRTVPLPWGAGGAGAPIAILDHSLWVVQGLGSEFRRIDTQSGKTTGRFQVKGATLYGAVATPGAVWLSSDSGVVRVDPETGRVVARIGFAAPVTRIVSADGYVWAASGSSGYVAKIDPSDNRKAASALLHGWLPDLAVGGGYVWVSFIPDGHVFKLAESNLGELASYAAGPSPLTLGYGGAGLWINDPDANTISLLDATTGRRSTFSVGSSPQLLRYRRGVLWTSGAAPTPPLPPIKGPELRISMTQGDIDADPATGTQPDDAQLFYETCENLYGYPDSAKPSGARLVPELAAAMPAVSADGRTYTIRVRPGIRFSPPSNELVTAETFRHTIERALSPKIKDAFPAPFASDIVGVGAFRAGRSSHISGIRVRGDTISFTLARPSGDFLDRISMYFFCPVPLSEPVVPSGLTGPIASTGPYYQSQIIGERTVLLRNPNYHGSRPRRWARIVYTTHFPTSQAVPLADAGKIDLLPADFDAYSLLVPGGPLDRAYGPTSSAARHGHQRYFLQDLPYIEEIVFNTGRPLFRDVRVRRAVNAALDRRALAAARQEAPTDQLLPAAIPGVRPSPLPPPRITRLGARRHAVLYAQCGVGTSKLPALIRSQLSRIGIDVSVVATNACSTRYTAEARRADLVVSWLGDPRENDPEPFLDPTIASDEIGAALGPGPWRSASFKRRVEAARALTGNARSEAYRRLAGDYMRAVPAAVYGSFQWPMYISPKLGCLTFQARYGFLDLGLLCKR